MYEITVIEALASGGSIMAHIPCQDEDVESTALGIIRDEDICVAEGMVLNYTTITNFFPNRDAVRHYYPQRATVINRNEV